MVHWAWLILAFVVGGDVGLFIMAAIACGRESDRMMEARYEDRKKTRRESCKKNIMMD